MKNGQRSRTLGIAVAMAATVGLTVAGCGSSGETGASPPTTAGSPSTTATTMAKGASTTAASGGHSGPGLSAETIEGLKQVKKHLTTAKNSLPDTATAAVHIAEGKDWWAKTQAAVKTMDPDAYLDIDQAVIKVSEAEGKGDAENAAKELATLGALVHGIVSAHG